MNAIKHNLLLLDHFSCIYVSWTNYCPEEHSIMWHYAAELMSMRDFNSLGNSSFCTLATNVRSVVKRSILLCLRSAQAKVVGILHFLSVCDNWGLVGEHPNQTSSLISLAMCWSGRSVWASFLCPLIVCSTINWPSVVMWIVQQIPEGLTGSFPSTVDGCRGGEAQSVAHPLNLWCTLQWWCCVMLHRAGHVPVHHMLLSADLCTGSSLLILCFILAASLLPPDWVANPDCKVC